MTSTPDERHLTSAMCELPSTMLHRQMESGSWSTFPRSPKPWYDLLARTLDVHDERYVYGDGWATKKMAYNLSEAVDKLLPRLAGMPPKSWRSAGPLRLYHDAAERS
jgi:hypothetical protein